jgi:hypothetical protein
MGNILQALVYLLPEIRLLVMLYMAVPADCWSTRVLVFLVIVIGWL